MIADEFPIVAITGTMPIGGSSTFLINLAHGLAGLDKRLVLIVMGAKNPYRDEYLSTGAVLHEISRAETIYEDRLAKVYELIASYRPKMVLSCLSAESFEIQRYMPQGVLRAGMVQADDPGVYRTVTVFSQWLDKIIGVSNTIRDKLTHLPEFGATKPEYIPYGIHFPSAVTRPPQNGPLRIVYAGRFVEEQKRISRVASVMESLASQSQDYEFTLIGTGPEEESLRCKLQELPGVRFAGQMSNKEVMEEFSRQDVFLLLSDYEGLPLTLLEAMGQGVVPVVSDLESGIRDVVTQDCGIRVPIGDVDEARKAISYLANNRLQLAEFAQTSMAKARNQFSDEIMAKKYLALINEKPVSQPIFRNGRLFWIHTPKDINPSWFYAQPMRTLRRLRKLFKRTRIT